VSSDQRRPPGLVASSLLALHQSVAVEHRGEGAHGGRGDQRELADQLVADLVRAPGGVFLLDPQDGPLDLIGQVVSLPTGCPTAVVQAVEPTVFVAVEDLVAGDPG
jgi:hypothetical protein